MIRFSFFYASSDLRAATAGAALVRATLLARAMLIVYRWRLPSIGALNGTLAGVNAGIAIGIVGSGSIRVT